MYIYLERGIVDGERRGGSYFMMDIRKHYFKEKKKRGGLIMVG